MKKYNVITIIINSNSRISQRSYHGTCPTRIMPCYSYLLLIQEDNPIFRTTYMKLNNKKIIIYEKTINICTFLMWKETVRKYNGW